jgi:hypothetical protein
MKARSCGYEPLGMYQMLVKFQPAEVKLVSVCICAVVRPEFESMMSFCMLPWATQMQLVICQRPDRWNNCMNASLDHDFALYFPVLFVLRGSDV